MASIIDNLNTKSPLNQRTAQSATQAASKMAAEKAGGSAPTTPTGQINVAAELNQSAAETQANQNIDQAAQAQQGLANQEMQQEVQQELAERQLNEQELAQQNSLANQTEALLNNYTNSQKSLDADRRDFNGQMLAQNLRLQNQKYMDELNDVARRENLDDEIAFAEKSKAIGRGNAFNQLRDQLDFERMEAMAKSDFQLEAGQQDIENALNIALSDINDAKTRQNWQMGANALGSAASAYGDFDSKKYDKSFLGSSDKPATTSTPKKEG